MVKKRNLQGYIDHSNKNDPHIISNSIPHKIKLDKHQLNYLHGDLVEFEIIKRKRKGFYYGKINCLKKREINNYVGHIEINKNFAFSIVENRITFATAPLSNATFYAIVLATTNPTPLQSLTVGTRTTAQTIDLHGRSMAVRTRGSVNVPIAFNLT